MLAGCGAKEIYWFGEIAYAIVSSVGVRARVLLYEFVSGHFAGLKPSLNEISIVVSPHPKKVYLCYNAIYLCFMQRKFDQKLSPTISIHRVFFLRVMNSSKRKVCCYVFNFAKKKTLRKNWKTEKMYAKNCITQMAWSTFNSLLESIEILRRSSI